ncbi:MAG: SurA N-terminal domain-containing protein [Sporichthyaceae bacterium]
MSRRLPIVATLGLVLLGSAACGPTQLGAAAVVDEDRITVAEVQETVGKTRALQEQEAVLVSQEGAKSAARSEVERRVVDLVFLRAAAEMGVSATDTEIAALVDAQRKAVGGPARFLEALAANSLNEDQVTDVFRTQVLSGKIAEKLANGAKLTEEQLNERVRQKLVAVAAGMRIKINPRYGAFDPETIGVDGSVVPSYLRLSRA